MHEILLPLALRPAFTAAGTLVAFGSIAGWLVWYILVNSIPHQPGEVINLVRRSGARGMHYHPVVSYERDDGGTATFIAHVGSSLSWHWRVGQRVEVFMRQGQPRLYAPGVMFFFCVVVCFIGLVAALGSASGTLHVGVSVPL